MHRKAAFGAFVIVSMLGSPFPAQALERSDVPVKYQWDLTALYAEMK